MKSEDMLACAVVEQAIEDLRSLLRSQVNERVTKKGETVFTKKEIYDFFSSEWCNVLLFLIHSNLSGVEIFKKVEGDFCDIF